MRIGLVRHYDVDLRSPDAACLLTPDQFTQFVRAYDAATCLTPQSIPNTSQFSTCFSSDLPRALNTARHMYSGRITATPELRELPIQPFTQRRVRLPLFLWLFFSRVAWLFGYGSQPESKRMLGKRISRFVDSAVRSGHADLLVVSHGITLYFLRRELRRRGFKGAGWRVAPTGAIRWFERPEADGQE